MVILQVSWLRVILFCGTLPLFGRFPCFFHRTHIKCGGVKAQRLPRLGIIAKWSLVVVRSKNLWCRICFIQTSYRHLNKACEIFFFSFYTLRFCCVEWGIACHVWVNIELYMNIERGDVSIINSPWIHYSFTWKLRTC